MTINFYLDNKSKKPEQIIFCFVRGIVKGKTIVLHTGQRINPKQWDKSRQKAIGKGRNKYNGSHELNAFLDMFKREIEKAYRVYLTENPFADYDSIKKAILNKFDKNKTYNNFFDVIDKYIEMKETMITKGSVDKIRLLKKHLKRFEAYSKEKISFQAIDLLFLEKLAAYYQTERSMTNNSVATLMKTLKNFLNWSTDRKFNTNPDFKKYHVRFTDIEVIYLTNQELMKLYTQDIENESLAKIRDCFCFGCFTGARHSDIYNLKRSDIKGDTWFLRTKKTKDILEIPINIYAKKILKKYRGDETPLPQIINQVENRYLSEICKMVDIDDKVTTVHYRGAERIEETSFKYDKITTHTARRTFIILSLEKGMRPEVVMSITGHKDYKTFKKYITISSKIKKSELFKAWNGR